MQQTITAANALAERWAATCSGASTVMAGPGAWPLLALLASAADGPGRGELETAVGLDAPAAGRAGAELLALLGDAPAVRSALGLWTRLDVPIEPAWAPPATAHGILTGEPAKDKRDLDAWAAEHTGGLIRSMPIKMEPGTLLVLASALTVRTQWFEPFDTFDGDASLYRTTQHLEDARVTDAPDGPVTLVRVAGTDDVDVHLVRGDQPPGQVLKAAFGTLDGRHPATTAGDLPEGTPAPGVTVWFEEAIWPTPQLRLTLPAFEVTGAHDLLGLPDVFGLASVRDTSRGHFPGISTTPLAIGQARQNALARFDAEGFESAAVTAVGALAGSAAPFGDPHLAKRVSVTFDPPFGFLAVHRPSGLVLTTGWVAKAGAA
ncbi:Serine protease inhibitor [Actinomadura madurae]|uniref:Serine protease inhibitor n=1 Tax=Actinomadura madurae TaxID=1993 RepID=A0A1I5XDU0_9ACTN|nr:serpin family protein [Actinomadura madurae]SFQ30153.1 Serine protease inhibitor [Actinomadura madurae]